MLFMLSEGEQEAEWLRMAGLSQLTASYEQGRELPESELDPALSLLPPRHAEAVRRRVKTLNLTVRQRGRQHRSRARKPDIRDVFRDIEVHILCLFAFFKMFSLLGTLQVYHIMFVKAFWWHTRR